MREEFFRRRLLERMLKAVGATSAGLALATACGGQSRGAGDAQAGGGQTMNSGAGGDGGRGGLAAGMSGGGAGGTLVSLGGFAGAIVIEPPIEMGVPRHLCLTPVPVGAAGRAWGLAGAGGTAGAGGVAGLGGVAGTSGTAGTAGEAPGGEASGGEASGGEASGGEASGGEGGVLPMLSIEDCPDPATAMPLLAKSCSHERLRDDRWSVIAIEAGPFLENGACCYDTLLQVGECVYVGRAFLVDDGLLKSTVRDGPGWRFGPEPDVASLSAATRRALSEAWVKDGLFEHASVATFARFAIQLLAAGAPAHLLHETLAAGRDEIRHAELCFALASAYAGHSLEPGQFPIGDALPVERGLSEIVAETIVEGCIGETLAALQAEAQLAVATDPAVVESLRSTIDDETRHAELAWRVVAWAIRTGGAEVRRTAERAFAGFVPPRAPRIDLEGVDLDAFAAHGRLTPALAREAALSALETVVRPCAAALLERDVMSHLAAASA